MTHWRELDRQRIADERADRNARRDLERALYQMRVCVQMIGVSMQEHPGQYQAARVRAYHRLNR